MAAAPGAVRLAFGWDAVSRDGDWTCSLGGENGPLPLEATAHLFRKVSGPSVRTRLLTELTNGDAER